MAYDGLFRPHVQEVFGCCTSHVCLVSLGCVWNRINLDLAETPWFSHVFFKWYSIDISPMAISGKLVRNLWLATGCFFSDFPIFFGFLNTSSHHFEPRRAIVFGSTFHVGSTAAPRPAVGPLSLRWLDGRLAAVHGCSTHEKRIRAFDIFFTHTHTYIYIYCIYVMMYIYIYIYSRWLCVVDGICIYIYILQDNIGIWLYVCKIYSGWWWLEHFLCFHIWRIIILIEFHIFRMGRYTTNQFLTCLFPRGDSGCKWYNTNSIHCSFHHRWDMRYYDVCMYI